MMPWYVWLLLGLATGGLVAYFGLLWYLSKGLRG